MTETLHLETFVSALLFIGLRVSGLMLFAPFLGNAGTTIPLRIGLTVAITALLYPVCQPAWPSSVEQNWLAIVGGEFLLGALLGLAAQLVLEAAQMAVQIIGIQAGYSLVTLFDPQTQADTTVMSTFSQLVATLIFLRLDVQHWLLRGLAASFHYVPPGTQLSHAQAGTQLLQAAGGIWLAGLQIAAPILVATMIVDITLGFLAKASPQMPVLFVGLPLKTVLSLLMLGGTLALWPGFFEQRFASGISLGERCMHLVR